jgi:hypothetical protein
VHESQYGDGREESFKAGDEESGAEIIGVERGKVDIQFGDSSVAIGIPRGMVKEIELPLKLVV